MTSDQTPAGWRDMKDAPRDGTLIVVFDASSNEAGVASWFDEDDEFDLDPGWVDAECEGRMYDPTHWMPHPDTGFADSLVVSEEAGQKLISAIRGMTDRTEELSMWDGVLALTAALPHAKTEAQVEDALLERLIAEAGKRRIIHVHRGAVTLKYETSSAGDVDSLADWLLARKGKSDG